MSACILRNRLAEWVGTSLGSQWQLRYRDGLWGACRGWQAGRPPREWRGRASATPQRRPLPPQRERRGHSMRDHSQAHFPARLPGTPSMRGAAGMAGMPRACVGRGPTGASHRGSAWVGWLAGDACGGDPRGAAGQRGMPRTEARRGRLGTEARSRLRWEGTDAATRSARGACSGWGPGRAKPPSGRGGLGAWRRLPVAWRGAGRARRGRARCESGIRLYCGNGRGWERVYLTTARSTPTAHGRLAATRLSR